MISPAQLTRRLDDALSVLSIGQRDTPERQHTLRSTLDWSHALLDTVERHLFRRLAIFAGGWSLEACEGVAGGDGLDTQSVLDVLSRLVTRSLVATAPGPNGSMRYHLLETVRQYAAERLRESGELPKMRARHAEWFLAWAERIHATSQRPLSTTGLFDQLDADLENVRLAVDTAMADPSDADRALRAIGRLWWFWQDRGRYEEGREFIQSLVERVGASASPESQAAALIGTGMLIWNQRSGAGLTEARHMLEQAVAIRRELPDKVALGHALTGLGRVVRDQGDARSARGVLLECLELATSIDNKQTIARSLHALGTLAYLEADFKEAMCQFERSLDVCQQIGDELGITTELESIASAAYQLDDIDRSLSLLKQGLLRYRRLGAHGSQPGLLLLIAGLAARLRQTEGAALLYGAAARMREQMGKRPSSGWGAAAGVSAQREIAKLRTRMGGSAFSVAATRGRELSLDQALDEALDVIDAISARVEVQQFNPSRLTGRERQVADLVAQGLTNRQIAAKLIFTESTAAKHVEHILQKLGFASRSQIAAWTATTKSS